jgi:Cu2+-exporting ATPase
MPDVAKKPCRICRRWFRPNVHLGSRRRTCSRAECQKARRKQVTAALAEHLGIKDYFAEVLPTDKADIIERLQANGASVCFVGDGINDTIALKKAHVSVSLHGASTVASDAASMVLMDGNLEKLGRLFEVTDGLRTNLRGDLLASFVPGAAAIGSVFLFHLGVLPSMLIGVGGNAVGIANAMLPRLPLMATQNPPLVARSKSPT